MEVAIGSKNPVKLEAVKQAFNLVWPEQKWKFIGINAKSLVPDQPMSDLESITGARNRARHAIEEAKAHYGVGLEGGLQQIGEQWFECGWMVVVDNQDREGIGSTIRLETPPKMIEMIKTGIELGIVSDILFGTENSKQEAGCFGAMTRNNITRSAGYRDGVIAALARFVQPHLFEKESNE